MFSILFVNATEFARNILFYRRQKPFVPGVWVQPDFEIDPQLIKMCGGEERTARSLVRGNMINGRSVEWATTKAIYDLERDRS